MPFFLGEGLLGRRGLQTGYGGTPCLRQTSGVLPFIFYWEPPTSQFFLIQLLVEINTILSMRQLQHRRMPSSRKFINGTPRQIMDRLQRQQFQQVPHFPCHTHKFTPMGM